jgi:hypothetical protein
MILEIHSVLLWVTETVNDTCGNDGILHGLVGLEFEVAGMMYI